MVVHHLLHPQLVDDGGWDDEDDHELDQLLRELHVEDDGLHDVLQEDGADDDPLLEDP